MHSYYDSLLINIEEWLFDCKEFKERCSNQASIDAIIEHIEKLYTLVQWVKEEIVEPGSGDILAIHLLSHHHVKTLIKKASITLNRCKLDLPPPSSYHNAATNLAPIKKPKLKKSQDLDKQVDSLLTKLCSLYSALPCSDSTTELCSAELEALINTALKIKEKSVEDLEEIPFAMDEDLQTQNQKQKILDQIKLDAEKQAIQLILKLKASLYSPNVTTEPIVPINCAEQRILIKRSRPKHQPLVSLLSDAIQKQAQQKTISRSTTLFTKFHHTVNVITRTKQSTHTAPVDYKPTVNPRTLK